MLHVLGIDEDFERTASAVLQDVVDGDVDGMIAIGPGDLVSPPFERLGALERLRHIDHRAGIADAVDIIPHFDARRFCRQDASGDRVRAIGGAALAAEVISLSVDVFESVK